MLENAAVRPSSPCVGQDGSASQLLLRRRHLSTSTSPAVTATSLNHPSVYVVCQLADWLCFQWVRSFSMARAIEKERTQCDIGVLFRRTVTRALTGHWTVLVFYASDIDNAFSVVDSLYSVVNTQAKELV